MDKIRCETCGLEVESIWGGGRALRFPDGAERACILTAPKHRPIECDAMQRAIIAAERRQATHG
jgi:hypothetical protein